MKKVTGHIGKLKNIDKIALFVRFYMAHRSNSQGEI